MKLIPAVPIEPCGIKLLEWSKGYKLSWGKVNHHFASVLNPTLEELADHGCIALYTMGIRNDRLIRGSSITTSTHANGLIQNGYKHWRDGSVGALGIDIRKVLFEHIANSWANSYYADETLLQTSLVVTDPGDLKVMIKFLEKRDFRLHHKGLNSVDPAHLHGQPKELGGVL